MRVYSFLKTSIILFVFSPLFLVAHPSGVSKLDIHFKNDSLLMSVVVNGPDILYALNTNSIMSRSVKEINQLNNEIAAYFQNRIVFKVDHALLAKVDIRSWTKENKSPDHRMDSTLLADTTFEFQLAYALPPNSKRLEMNVFMYAEFEQQVISQVSFYWKDQLLQRKWLEIDDNFSFNISPDSMDAILASQINPNSQVVQSERNSVFFRFVKMGFEHILPLGVDHILFVLGLFLFSTKLRPLLIQVSAFTLAHSITLAMAMLGVFSLPGRIVEPLIALSIAVIAIENILFRTLRPWRWMLVFGFGLIHGLGLASALKDLGLIKSQFLSILIGFNVGVEIGQLSVITIAAALTFWFWKKEWYFKRIVLPASLGIAAMGLFWAITRALGV